MENWINHIIWELSLDKLFLISTVYFLFLYFIIGSLFLKICIWLSSKGIASKIIQEDIHSKQHKFEIKKSLISILIFGFSSLPVVYLIRNNSAELLPNTIFNITIGLLILNIWNEVHFYIVHRIMHLPWFLRNVHYIHHQSKISTVYSVFSFHWLEALLLSTLPITIICFVNFSPIAIFLYPLTSILLNFSGHCNYRIGKKKETNALAFGTRHNQHHYQFTKKYGFVSGLLDKLFN
tara:strand:+ start:254 stop:961 length:708 start_codon:yes stop_codon:yes gene_type:complete